MTVLTWSARLLILTILDHLGPRSLGRLARAKLLLLGEQRLPPKIHTPPDNPLLRHRITTHIRALLRGDRLAEVVDRRLHPNARELRGSRLLLACNCVWIRAAVVVVAASRRCVFRAAIAHVMRARVHARAFGEIGRRCRCERTFPPTLRTMVGGAQCPIVHALSAMVGGVR